MADGGAFYRKLGSRVTLKAFQVPYSVNVWLSNAWFLSDFELITALNIAEFFGVFQ